MKDKQKKKKERTWAEAARLVRRAARGAAAGGLGGGLPRGSRGGGGSSFHEGFPEEAVLSELS